MFQNLHKDEEEWAEEDQMEYLSAKMDELIMKQCDENTETGVIEVYDEDQKKDKEPVLEERKKTTMKPQETPKTTTKRGPKKRERKECEKQSNLN